MTEREMYELPYRNVKNIGKKHFVVRSIMSMIFVDAISCVIIALCFGTAIGFFPIYLSILLISIMGMLGCVYYIRKHDYAYGTVYEKYQVVNAVIYGIQNILRTLLILLLISVLIVPIYSIVIVIFAVIILFGITRRCW